MTQLRSLLVWFLGPVLALFGTTAAAQNADELAKQLSNPVASLISVPLQFNYDDGFGPGGDGSRFLLNIQPVVPVSLNDDWALISRTILPVISQEDVIPGTGSQSGLGDVTQSFFFSPKAPTASGWIWGVGPAFLVPIGTDDLLGSEKWGTGPTAVVLKQTAGGWTYGALANHIWSVAGDDDRAAISSTFFQPFLSKGLGKGRTASVNLESSYDWKGEQWNVPLNVGYSVVSKNGTQMVSYYGGVRYYLETPDGGPDWGVRFTFDAPISEEMTSKAILVIAAIIFAAAPSRAVADEPVSLPEGWQLEGNELVWTSAVPLRMGGARYEFR